MKSIDFLKNKGLDVEPNIMTEQYRPLVFTGEELAKLLDEYADLVIDQTMDKIFKYKNNHFIQDGK